MTAFDIAAGYGGTTVWSTKSGQGVPTPTRAGSRGATTALCWLMGMDNANDGLAYGTSEGYLCIWTIAAGEDYVSLIVLLNKLEYSPVNPVH